jgi:hypothetical protein
MQVLTPYRFSKFKYQIPNLNKFAEFSCTVEESVSSTIVRYMWNRDLLLMLKVKKSDGDIIELYRDDSLCVVSGLFINTPLSWLAVIDSLYYKCNPFTLDLESKTEDQRAELISKLQTRLDKPKYSSGSVFTSSLLDTVFKFHENKVNIVRPTNTSSLEEIKEYLKIMHDNSGMLRGVIWRAYFDIATLKWADHDSTVGVEIRITGFRVSKLVNLRQFMGERFGYVSVPGFNSRFFNPLTEVVVENTIYLKSEIELVPCSECGQTHPRFNMRSDICNTCSETLGKIHSYSTRAPSLLKFKATKVVPNTLYLGTELEYESNRDTKIKDAMFANKVLKDHAILKTDGSIQQGFEIVSCPATLDIHLVEFKLFFEGLKTKTTLRKESNTGMHVHISRKPLSMLTVGKMTAFLNDPKNVEFITKIAGRELNHFCRQDTNRTVSFPLTNGSGDRYNTLNLNNPDTVELRIFSTPETFEEFAYKLEFSEALAIYCSPCTVNLSVYKLLDYKYFKDWVMNSKHSYPHLATKLKSL